MAAESPLEAICRRAREHDAEVIAHPDRFSADEVARAKLAEYHRTMLEPAAILRYGD
jgi:hypothetical protein